jgi:hypothetical protein
MVCRKEIPHSTETTIKTAPRAAEPVVQSPERAHRAGRRINAQEDQHLRLWDGAVKKRAPLPSSNLVPVVTKTWAVEKISSWSTVMFISLSIKRMTPKI